MESGSFGIYSTLSLVCGLVSLVCWIITLIQMFKSENGVLQGILGIITCGLWAFIWGWIHVKETGQKGVMIAWTIVFLGSIAFNVLAIGEGGMSGM